MLRARPARVFCIFGCLSDTNFSITDNQHQPPVADAVRIRKLPVVKFPPPEVSNASGLILLKVLLRKRVPFQNLNDRLLPGIT